MKIGVIDLGSLSLRFDIYEVSPHGKPELLFRHRSMPRLGENFYAHQTIDEATFARIISEFEKIREEATRHQTTHLAAVGTSAVREISQHVSLIETIAQKSGITIVPISGVEEAQLTALGILENETDLPEEILLVDIGGGSTEFSFCKKKKVCVSLSVELGASRLQQMFFEKREEKTGLYPKNAANHLREYVRQSLELRDSEFENFHPQQVVGSSGTIRALERLQLTESAENPIIRLDTLATFNQKMLTLRESELRSLPGMDEPRVDVIIPGALLFEDILRFFQIPEARVTHYSLRHGLLRQEMQKLGLCS